MILGALFPFLAVAVPIATADDAELSRLVAEDVARRVLTLPTYYGLDLDVARDIAENVLEMV